MFASRAGPATRLLYTGYGALNEHPVDGVGYSGGGNSRGAEQNARSPQRLASADAKHQIETVVAPIA
eukprot:scaffold1458_cov146-Isochrysis_galbana.AAC.3